VNAAHVRKLYESTGALLTGHFRLSSGLHSDVYLQSALVLQFPDHARRLGAALAELLTDLDAEQILSLAGYIAERTGVGIDTVANAVIDNLEHQPRPNSTKPDARATSPPAAITDMGPAPDRRPRRGRPFLPPFVARGTAMPAGSHPVPGVTARPGRRR